MGRQRIRRTPDEIRRALERGEKVPWYGLISADGDLVSVGTESMFEGGVRPEGDTYANYDIVDFGETQPDMRLNVWERSNRRFVARPIPVKADRVSDIRARLEADPDWSAEVGRLSAQRRDTVYTGLARVLDVILGSQRYREEDEAVEL